MVAKSKGKKVRSSKYSDRIKFKNKVRRLVRRFKNYSSMKFLKGMRKDLADAVELEIQIRKAKK